MSRQEDLEAGLRAAERLEQEFDGADSDLSATLRGILKTVPIGIGMVELPERTILWVNPTLCTMLGYESQEMVNQSARILYPNDEEFSRVGEITRDLGKMYGVGSVETVFKTKDGSLLDVILSSALRSARGDIVVFTATDITERMRTGKELAESKERLQALVDLSQMTESTEEEIGEFVLKKAIELTGSETGFINFMSEDGATTSPYSYASKIKEMCKTEMPKSFPINQAGLWAEAVRTGKPVIINDYSKPHPGKKGLPEGHAPLTRVLITPVFDSGNIVIVVAVANKALPYDETDATQIGLLMEGLWGRIKRDRAEESIRASLAEKELLLREVHHRVKNNLQIIYSLLDMSGRRTKDREARELIKDMQSKVLSMSLIHNVLYDLELFNSIDIGSYSRDLFRNISSMYDPTGELLEADFELEAVPLSLEKAIPCGLALNEALTNVFKHAVGRGGTSKVKISTTLEDGEALIWVADNGPGFGPDFNAENQSTIGIKLIRSLVEMQLKGEVRFFNDDGAVVTLRFGIDD